MTIRIRDLIPVALYSATVGIGFGAAVSILFINSTGYSMSDLVIVAVLAIICIAIVGAGEYALHQKPKARKNARN